MSDTKRRLAALSVVALMSSLIQPVSADTAISTGDAAEMLRDATGDDLVKKAYANCLFSGAGSSAVEVFAKAGWEVFADDEAGFAEIAGPEDINALTWTDGGFCLVQSERVGSDRARALLDEVIETSGLITEADESGDCPALRIAGGGPRIEVTSSGNDPVCSAPDTSGVSFMWAETE